MCLPWLLALAAIAAAPAAAGERRGACMPEGESYRCRLVTALDGPLRATLEVLVPEGGGGAPLARPVAEARWGRCGAAERQSARATPYVGRAERLGMLLVGRETMNACAEATLRCDGPCPRHFGLDRAQLILRWQDR